jgi:hypothetical protein
MAKFGLMLKFVFTIMGLAVNALLESPDIQYTHARAMTRCECSGVGFSDLARLMGEHRCSHDQAMDLTGAGQTCTACVPDLEMYLASLNLL